MNPLVTICILIAAVAVVSGLHRLAQTSPRAAFWAEWAVFVALFVIAALS